MSESGESSKIGPLKFEAGTLSDLIDDSDNQIDGLVIGKRYRISACSGSAICRWSATAASTSAWHFIVPRDSSVIVTAQFTSLSIIESDTSSDAAARLYVQPLDEANM